MAKVDLKKIRRAIVSFRIRGTTPLIQHKWSEKAKAQMRDKHAGKKTKAREVRNPQQEAKDATYTTVDGNVGIPAMALKKAILFAAHKDIGIERTLVRKALFLKCDDPGLVIPIDADEPILREDSVTVGMSQTDLRYRPEFRNWSADVRFEIDAELLTPEDLITLVNRAGFGVGIGEMRPERDGEFGRFEVDITAPMQTEELD